VIFTIHGDNFPEQRQYVVTIKQKTCAYCEIGAAGLAESLQLDSPGFDSRERKEIFPSSNPFRLALGPIQPILYVTGFFPGGGAAAEA
jgi:hypothetical protein